LRWFFYYYVQKETLLTASSLTDGPFKTFELTIHNQSNGAMKFKKTLRPPRTKGGIIGMSSDYLVVAWDDDLTGNKKVDVFQLINGDLKFSTQINTR
jgi:hypothetical protein